MFKTIGYCFYCSFYCFSEILGGKSRFGGRPCPPCSRKPAYTITKITEQEQSVQFEDLLLSPEKEIVCVHPLIYKEDSQYHFKLQKKVKQAIEIMANDFLLLSDSNDNDDDEKF